ncbi:hypothetical protein NMK71_07450 [Weeksellaceae bacterium KMM 9713]|uniref:Uncharacterized protein n=1 Tax=Profundicola chukchiensis TaxID=2961959 RepID=A0A9X4RXE5_9FLAO|nr:hypothetical protein [Profundicola chukchiensis]MDG4946244.1 hypothetical protein [Profundicola chukchiensis]
MKLSEKNKHILKTLLVLSSSSIYFFLAYIGYENSHINLNQIDSEIGIVDEVGITQRIGTKGERSKVFFIQLDNIEKKLGVYRKSKNYSELINNIKPEDEIKVYYKAKSNKRENVNLDLVQIEKNGKIILPKNEFENKQSFLIYIGLFFGIGSIIFSYLYYFNSQPRQAPERNQFEKLNES